MQCSRSVDLATNEYHLIKALCWTDICLLLLNALGRQNIPLESILNGLYFGQDCSVSVCKDVV